MCTECSKLSGPMKKRKSSKTNMEYLGGAAGGVIIAPVVAQLAAKIVPDNMANNAEIVTGGIVAVGGYYLSQNSKSNFMKGLGDGLMLGGINVGIGATVRKSVDGLFSTGTQTPTNTTLAERRLTSTLNQEAILQRRRIAA